MNSCANLETQFLVNYDSNHKRLAHICLDLQMPSLIQKYNVPGPRYTSYPTVPFWDSENYHLSDWLHTLKQNYAFFKDADISLYIHLPFCESLCTFCGCHKRITKNHSVEEPYIDSVLKEWMLYKNQLPFKPIVRELHLGGGTPTFFKPSELLRLLEGIFGVTHVNPSTCSLSFEAHPNNTSNKHLENLYDFGFRRISLGVQDYNHVVQQAIHRIQPFSQVKCVHDNAKEIGYDSINNDLVFGLPKQTLSDIQFTIEKTLELMPDRIALYSYAHVPWIKGNGQRGFCDEDIPKDEEKRVLYETAKNLLLKAGYIEIGMDHFALPSDELTHALIAKKLHRNFMGYTTQSTNLLLGLGMSAISDSWFGFAQNEKNLEEYQMLVNKGEIFSS